MAGPLAHSCLLWPTSPAMCDRLSSRDRRVSCSAVSSGVWAMWHRYSGMNQTFSSGGHPVQTIEAPQVYGPRKRPQRALAAQVVVLVEVAHGQFAQAAVNGLAKAQPGKVGLGNGSPVSVVTVNGKHVVNVACRLEIPQQWCEPIDAQRGRRKDRAFQTMCRPFAQHATWRPRSRSMVIRRVIQEPLDQHGRAQRSQAAQLQRGEAVGCSHSILPSFVSSALPWRPLRLSF
jgi:hypothetical protein